jgi:uncharacterized SAM-binding protein YcdF (DUF218 family)
MILFIGCLLYGVVKSCFLWQQFQRRVQGTSPFRSVKFWFGVLTVICALGGMLFGMASDIVVQKLIGMILMPAGLVWLALLIGTIILWLHPPRKIAVFSTLIWLGYTLAGNTWLGDALLKTLQEQIPPVDIQRTPTFDAVFILGGGTNMSENGAFPNDAGDRIILAAQLFHAGKTPLIITSGSGIDDLDGQPRDLASETVFILTGLGVPAERIISLSPGLIITRHEMAAYKTFVDEHHLHHVAVISSAWHLPRALRSAARFNFHPTPLGADRRAGSRGWSPFYLVPQRKGFENLQIACWEYLGMLAGR